MTGQVHMLVGSVVLAGSLAVGLWALVLRRLVTRPFIVAFVALTVVLLLQILIGLDLWGRGLRPAAGALSAVHIAGPLVALAVAVVMLVRRPRRPLPYALSSFLMLALAALGYAIGQAGAA